MQNVASSLVSGGGALGVAKGAGVTLTGGGMRYNVAAYGGAISASASTLAVRGLTYVGNSASQTAGAVMLQDAVTVVSFSNTTFRGNTAASVVGGGAIYSQSSSPSFTECTFTANEATGGEGGAVKFDAPASPSFTRCSFTNNVAKYSGGAACFSGTGGTGVVNSTHFEANRVTQASAGGGGIAVSLEHRLHVVDSTFIRHIGTRGAALYVDGASPIVERCSFDHNVAFFGSVAIKSYASPAFRGCKFRHNRGTGGTLADPAQGAGLALDGKGTPSVDNCTFANNSMQGPGQGGGAWVGKLTIPTLYNSTFSGNAALSGGGLYVTSQKATKVRGCTFSRNTAAGAGGGLAVASKAFASTHHSRFDNNTAQDGAAIAFIEAASGSLYDIRVGSNLAAGFGAISIGAGATLTAPLKAIRCIRNQADVGGCIYWAGPTPQYSGSCEECVYEFNLALAYGSNRATDVATVASTHNASDRWLAGMPSRSFPFYGNLPIAPTIQAHLYDAFGQLVNDTANGDAVECVVSPTEPAGWIISKGQSIALSEKGALNFRKLALAGQQRRSSQLEVRCTMERCLADDTKVRYTRRTNLTIEALDCAPGMEAAYDSAKRALCKWCKATTYSLIPNSPACHPCPEGAICNGGLTYVTPDEGYWNTVKWGFNRSDLVYECPVEESCVGGKNASCGEGHCGKLCSECITDYSWSAEFGCQACAGANIWTPIIGAAMLVLAVAMAAVTVLALIKCYTAESNEELAALEEKDSLYDKNKKASLGDDSGGVATGIQMEMTSSNNGSGRGAGGMTTSGEKAATGGLAATVVAGAVVAAGSVEADAVQQDELTSAMRDQAREEAENAAGGSVEENMLMEQNEQMGEHLAMLSDSGGIGAEIAAASQEITEAMADMADRMGVALKVLVGYLQVLTSVSISCPSIPWPTAFKNYMSFASPISFDFGRIFPMACYVQTDGYQMFLFHAALPIIGGAAIVAVGLWAKMKATADEDNDSAEGAVDAIWSRVLVMFFILYPILSQQSLLIFRCRQIGDDFWLDTDLRLQCYTQEWELYAWISAASLFLYALGIPLLAFILLYCNSDNLTEGIHESEAEQAKKEEEEERDHGCIRVGPTRASVRYAILYEGYSVLFYYGELLEMVRKLGLTGLVIFVYPGQIMQSGIFLALCGLFMFLHVKFEPFENEFDNRIAMFVHIGLTTTIFCGIMMQMSMCELVRDVTGMSEFSKVFFATMLLVVNVTTMLAIMWISITTVLWRQLRIIFIVTGVIMRLVAAKIATEMTGSGGNSGEEQAAEPELFSDHTEWLRHAAAELSEYYSVPSQLCATEEGATGFTLACFARLLARWDARMKPEDMRQWLTCVRSVNHPWVASPKALELWVRYSMGGLDLEVCLGALDHLMPPELAGKLQVRLKGERAITAWLEGESLEDVHAQAVGLPGSKGESLAPSLMVQVWAQQLVKMFSYSGEGISSQVMHKVVALVSGDEAEARRMCEDPFGVWQQEQVEAWLEKKRFASASHFDFLSALLRVMAPNPKEFPIDRRILKHSSKRVDVASQAGYELVMRMDPTRAGRFAEMYGPQEKRIRRHKKEEKKSQKKEEEVKPEEAIAHVQGGWNDATFDSVFDRYDLDGSDRLTYGDKEEVGHLTVALIIKMSLPVDPASMDAAVEALVLSGRNNLMEKGDYRHWFIESFDVEREGFVYSAGGWKKKKNKKKK